MKKKTSKLTFQRETLRLLSDRVLVQVAGGEPDTGLGGGCTSSFVAAVTGGERK